MISPNATPKQIAGEFLKNWKLKKSKKAHVCCTHTWQGKYNYNQFRAAFHVRPEKYTVKKVEIIKDVVALVHFNMRIGGEDRKGTLRCIKEVEPFKPSPDGYWGVYPPSIRFHPLD